MLRGDVCCDQGDAGSAGVLLTALSASRWLRQALSQMFWPIEVVPGHSKKGAAESGGLQLGSAYRQSLMSVTLMCSRRRLRMFLRRVLLFWSPNLCRFQRKKASFCDRVLFSLLNADSAKRQPLPARCGLIVCVIAFPPKLCLYTYD